MKSLVFTMNSSLNTKLFKDSWPFLFGCRGPASPCHPQGRRWRCRGHRCPHPGNGLCMLDTLWWCMVNHRKTIGTPSEDHGKMELYPLVMTDNLLLNMAMEKVDLPMNSGGSFYVIMACMAGNLADAGDHRRSAKVPSFGGPSWNPPGVFPCVPHIFLANREL